MPGTDSDPVYDRESRLSMILGVIGLFHTIAVVFSSLRAYTRLFIKRSYEREEYVIALSTLCASACFVILILQGKYGLGKHSSTIPMTEEIIRGKLDFILTLIINVGVCLLKISIALSLLSLIKGTSTWMARSLWALIAFVGVYTIVALLTNTLHCSPVSGAWDPNIDAHCYSLSLLLALALSNSSFSMLSDLALAVLPVPIIWKLEMPIRTRLYVVGVLSLGYLAVGMCAVKVYYQFNYASDTDPTFLYSIQFYYLLEFNIGISATCAPYLKPLINQFPGLSTGNYSNSLSYDNRPIIGGAGVSTFRRGYPIQDSEDGEGTFELRKATTDYHVTSIRSGGVIEVRERPRTSGD